jgi:predicted Zn-dependent protease with MMP-like domain
MLSSVAGCRAVRVSREEFEALVEEAVEQLPAEFKVALDNVAVMVEEEPSEEDLEEVGIDPGDPDADELFGLYQGVPLTERDGFYGALPDRVLVYRGPILRSCETRRQVIREIRETVQHELGHYFGLEEDELPF